MTPPPTTRPAGAALVHPDQRARHEAALGHLHGRGRADLLGRRVAYLIILVRFSTQSMLHMRSSV